MKIKKGNYRFSKIKSLSEASRGNISEELLMDNCRAVIENGILKCSLNYHSDLVKYEWFRTSKIDKVIDTGNGYEVYTANSVYLLEDLK